MAITPKTYNNILTKGLKSALDLLEIQDGKLRFTTDTGEIFLDDGNNRISIANDIIKGYTENQIKALLAPLPKFYYSSDTNKILFYVNNDWIVVGNDVEYAESATCLSIETVDNEELLCCSYEVEEE